jgi:hypothetical protein
LPAGTAVQSVHLTEFEDGASPRPGTNDLFFAAAADQSVVDKIRWVHPARTQYAPLLWLGGALLVLAGVLYLLYRLVRAAYRAIRR